MAGKRGTKFSYTRLEQYVNCPFAYFLKYDRGNYLFTPTVATTFGSLVHKVLEDEANYIKAGIPIDYDALKEEFYYTDKVNANEKDSEPLLAIDEISKMFPVEWEDSNTKSGKSYAEKAQEFIDKGLYRLPKYMQEHPDLEIVGCEIPFEFEYKGHTFNGYIDRLLRQKGTNNFVIHDIKTKDSLFTNTATCLQFVVYTLALQNIYGDDIQCQCVYDLPMIDTWQSVCTNGYMNRGLKKIDTLFNGIENKDWTPNPTALCYWCPYRFGGAIADQNCKQLCSYYSLWTPTEKTFKHKLEWKGIEYDYKQLEKLKLLESLNDMDDDDIEI